MFGAVESLLLTKAQLRGQRVVLVTSVKGAGRRSSKLVQYLLRQKLNCQVFCEVITEPGMGSVQSCEKLAKHVGANVLIGLGGSSVMDVGKLACSRAEMDYFMAIPTIPCAGGENHLSANLFDFDKETEITLSNLPIPSHSCLVDCKLGWEDNISSQTDRIALLNCLSVGVDEEDRLMGNDEFANCAAQSIHAARMLPPTGKFTVEDRQQFFRTSLSLSSQLTNPSLSFGFALTNAICREIPLPRTLVRAALFYPTVAVQVHVRGNASKMQHLTNASDSNQALERVGELTKLAGLERGVVGLLPNFFTTEHAGKLIPQLVDLFKHTAVEHQRKHDGELLAEEMLFGMAAEET
ncbi:hypothetical protein BASA81_002720 [Batrachochytrium salamandrivorans]|nr:hypothetical protein BASA81_002720 [Batrachochytrium salamandrivorans]